MEKTTEQKLMEMTNTEIGKKETTNLPKPKESLKAEDIKDLISKEKEQPLIETDYLILTEFSQATPLEVICEEYNVKQTYVKALLRRSNAIEFLKKIKANTEMQMMIRGSAVIGNVYEKKLSYIDSLMKEGKDNVAFQEMFGKLSFVEVQEKLAKMNNEGDEDKTAPLQNFFFSLQG